MRLAKEEFERVLDYEEMKSNKEAGYSAIYMLLC
jgi:hypothetical protein